jgi:hypothetical protein
MGVEETQRFCEVNPALGALLVCPGEHPGAVEITTVGIEESDWRRLV